MKIENIPKTIDAVAYEADKRGEKDLESLLSHIAFLVRQEDHGAIKVLARHAKRYSMGNATYGVLDPKNDKRNFLRELANEMYDGLMYLESELIKDEQ